MKVGDIVYCKRDYGYETNPIFRKGNFYNISEILIEEDGTIWVSIHFADHYLFNITKKIDRSEPINYFYNYFDDKKEIRRRKLQKLKLVI